LLWRIELSDTAKKQLRRLDPTVARRIALYLSERVGRSDDPRKLGKALTGSELGGYWRNRVGDYRIICELEDGKLVVLVLIIGHRSDVYC
jgi:mRNA interferase RelE/StbE